MIALLLPEQLPDAVRCGQGINGIGISPAFGLKEKGFPDHMVAQDVERHGIIEFVLAPDEVRQEINKLEVQVRAAFLGVVRDSRESVHFVPKIIAVRLRCENNPFSKQS